MAPRSRAKPDRASATRRELALRRRLEEAGAEIRAHLRDGIVPFWRDRALDRKHGGYLVRFDEAGRSLGTPIKYLNTQCRLLWWFSTLARIGEAGALAAARHGFTFIRAHFWDRRHGGWFWTVNADGSPLDRGKVVYGQSFAVYACAEYARASGDTEALNLAERTFELLQTHCADVRHGGYLENLEPDWTLSAPGFHAGDRKSLDTHMHLMEAFTTLLAASGKDAHRRKLLDVAGLILDRMIEPKTGCGRNQFDHAFTPLPAIAIRRTWNAERAGEAPAQPVDTTSYGHNAELAWLMRLAYQTACCPPGPAELAMQRLLDHAVEHGIDRDFGGIFRDGTASGGALVLEKEFWQHAEALVGFLDGFERYRKPRYAEAFLNLWRFVRTHFIAPCGEWRVLLGRDGRPIDADVGNDWKVSYHTGRAMLECERRLAALLSR